MESKRKSSTGRAFDGDPRAAKGTRQIPRMDAQKNDRNVNQGRAAGYRQGAPRTGFIPEQRGGFPQNSGNRQQGVPYGAHAASHASPRQEYVSQDASAAASSGSGSGRFLGGIFGSQPPSWFLRTKMGRTANPLSRWQVFRVILYVVLALLVVYLGGVIHFSSHYYPSSAIGSVDISGMTTSEAATALQRNSDSYVLEVSDDNLSFVLSGSEAGLSVDGDAIASQAMKENNAWTWPVALLFQHDHTDAMVASYNSSGLSTKVKAEVDAYNETATAPSNATIAYDSNTASFKIVAEVEGNTLDYDKVLADIDDAVIKMQGSLTLTSDDYKHPTVRSSDANLKQALKDAAAVVKTNLTFTVNSTEVATLNADTVATWVTTDATGAMSFDEAALNTWSANLAEECTTVGTTRTWTRADGTSCMVTGGVFGWDVDSEELLSEIKAAVSSGKTETITIPMTSEGDVFNGAGERDWGAYIDVDLGDQHAIYYDADGTVLWESDFVSGIPDGEHDTPQGVYVISNKQSPSTLIGNANASGSPEYETVVQYWMPWVGNSVGLHDASWQTAFGGTRYQDGYGSHGCINLSTDVAGTLYNLISIGTVVVSHS